MPLQEAHAKNPILCGQFMRGLLILKETLEQYEAPQEVRNAWLPIPNASAH